MARSKLQRRALMQLEAYDILKEVVKIGDYQDLTKAIRKVYPDATDKEVAAAQQRLLTSDYFIRSLTAMVPKAMDEANKILEEGSEGSKVRIINTIFSNQQKVYDRSQKQQVIDNSSSSDGTIDMSKIIKVKTKKENDNEDS